MVFYLFFFAFLVSHILTGKLISERFFRFCFVFEMDTFYVSSDGTVVSQNVSLVHNSYGTQPKQKKSRCSCCNTSAFSPQAVAMIVVNILFLLVGIMLIVIGSWSIANQDYYKHFVASATYGFVTWTLIFVGVFIAFSAILGLYAAFKEAKLLLKVWFFDAIRNHIFLAI